MFTFTLEISYVYKVTMKCFCQGLTNHYYLGIIISSKIVCFSFLKQVTSPRKSTCGESSSLIFEEMHWLVNVLQHDLGLDMRVHDSTFLWFIPFVKSVMDLDDLSMVYIEEVINYLCGEIKDPINGQVQTCDKVTEVFTFILVRIIEFHLSRSRMNVLYYPSPKWVEVVVKCATLPSTAFSLISDSGSYSLSSTSLSRSSPVKIAVPQACMHTIRCLLREGGKLTSHSKVMHFLDLLNKQIRDAPQKQWKLTDREAIELQGCLKQLVKVMKEKHSAPSAALTDCIENMYPEMTPVCSSDIHRFTEDCPQAVKREPVWDNERYGRMDESPNNDVNVKAVQQDSIVAKKEALDPEHDHVATSIKLKGLLQSAKLLDPNKVQAIKSKLGQSLPKLKVIATKFNFKDLEGMSSEHQPGLNRTAEEFPNIAGNEEHLAVVHSDDFPLSVVKSHLKKTQKLKHLSAVSINEANRDHNEKDMSANEGDIHGLESGTEVSKPLRRIKQKVNKTLENAQNDVIVISDSELTENSDISLHSNKGTGNESGKTNSFKVKTESHDADAERSPGDIYGGDLNECDSQLFEFESQDHVYSEWSHCSVYTGESAPETKKEKTVSEMPPSPGVMASSSTCEYDTDPVSDESIENTVSLLEDRLKKQKISSRPKASVGADTVFRRAKDLPVKCTGKRIPLIKKRIMQPHKKESKPKGAVTASGSSSAATGMPAIVPPKKVRKPVESVSTVEKLGLKKKERIAPDLSQRSSECVGKLRKHGQEVRVEPGLRTRRTRKSKMIRPQKMSARCPKKLLASQDIQFFRQSRANRSSLPGLGAADHTIEHTRAVCSKGDHIVESNADEDDELRRTSLTGSVAGIKGGERKVGQRPEEGTQKLNASELNLTENNKQSSSLTQFSSNCVQKPDLSRCSLEHKEGVDHMTDSTFEDKPSGVSIASDDGDLEDVCLTQNQPLDMELCSQMEDDVIYTQRDPIDMDIEPESQMNNGPSFHNDQQGDKLVLEGSAQVEPVAPEVLTGQTDNNDHVFLKPGMLPSLLKKAKPSTTKIYAPSSRNATLAEEMEKTTKLPQAARRPLPAPRTNIPPSEFKRPLPPKRHVSFKPLPTPSSATGALPHVPTYKTYQRPEAPVVGTVPYSEVGTRLDQAILIGDVLKWTYDMFTNYDSFGIPLGLRQLKEVSPSYRSYDEYFRIFYPLLLNNTFEEVCNKLSISLYTFKTILVTCLVE